MVPSVPVLNSNEKNMSKISLRNVSISFGLDPLLDKVDLQIEEKERVCILGRNGTGKSTLLKLIHDEIQADSGEIIRQQDVYTAKLEQDVPNDIQGTVYEVITQKLGNKGMLLARHQHLLEKMSTHTTMALAEELAAVQHAIDEAHAWDLSYKIETIISRLSLPGEQAFAALSGGLKRRVLLGQALVNEPTVLLLDEPTNHLDITAIEWLEKFLKEFNQTVIFITHDRQFMQNVATRFIEIDRGKIQSYPGNYAQYLGRKQHELDVEATHHKLFDKKLKQEEIWIRQGIKARRTRNEGRVRALEALREIRKSRREVLAKAKLQLQEGEKSGKLVIEAQNLRYAYHDKQLINDFSTTIVRGDKIGLIGPNGVGKTTLLKILLGELKPQQGMVHHGTKLEIAYFDQLRAHLEEEKTVADNVSYGDQYVTVNGKSIHIMTYLQDFLFSPERARTPVKALSGGERNRLLLARLFTKPTNLLVLDEPTNDLDVETLELLEELLMEYKGTLLLVSHDRRFLNNIVTSTIVFTEGGKIEEFVGGYDDWLNQTTHQKNSPQPVTEMPKASTEEYTNRKEIAALERKIEKLENEQGELKHQLASPDLYQAEKTAQLQQLQQKLQKIELELTELIVRWERYLGS